MRKIITFLLSLFILVVTFGCSTSQKTNKIDNETLTYATSELIDTLIEYDIDIDSTTVQLAYYITYSSSYKKLVNDFASKFEKDFYKNGINDMKKKMDIWFACFFLLKSKGSYYTFSIESGYSDLGTTYSDIEIKYQVEVIKIMPVVYSAYNILYRYIEDINDEHSKYIENHKNASSKAYSVSNENVQPFNKLLKGSY